MNQAARARARAKARQARTEAAPKQQSTVASGRSKTRRRRPPTQAEKTIIDQRKGFEAKTEKIRAEERKIEQSLTEAEDREWSRHHTGQSLSNPKLQRLERLIIDSLHCQTRITDLNRQLGRVRRQQKGKK